MQLSNMDFSGWFSICTVKCWHLLSHSKCFLLFPLDTPLVWQVFLKKCYVSDDEVAFLCLSEQSLMNSGYQRKASGQQ